MLTLALETSGHAGSIALLEAGQLRTEIELAATGRRHARTLVPEIGSLLKTHGLSPRQIDLLAVSIGPGSFTGLRVGIVCAKTFAYATGCSLVGVDTFLALAAAQPEADHVWVIEDALRGDICAGEYCCREGQWTTLRPPRLLSLEAWQQQIAPGTAVTGPGLRQFADALGRFQLVDSRYWLPSAREIALRGEVMWQQGEKADPWTLEPFYMRRSAAEEKADAAIGNPPGHGYC